MKTTLTVSRSGAISLPRAMREAAGFCPGEVLTAQITATGILLKLAPRTLADLYATQRGIEFAAAEGRLSRGLARRGRRAR